MVGALTLAVGGACKPSSDADVARGRGLEVADLPPSAQASVYAEAVRASFDPDPSLVLRVHPLLLPRTAGDAGGDAISPALVKALVDQGVVQGTCEPKHEIARDTPRCPGHTVGYVIRASPVFRVGHDTVQINFSAEEYAAQTGPKSQSLRFEKVYQLVGHGQQWHALREARVKELRR
jgi:hypothetical protein